jgi:hypothetical protein
MISLRPNISMSLIVLFRTLAIGLARRRYSSLLRYASSPSQCTSDQPSTRPACWMSYKYLAFRKSLRPWVFVCTLQVTVWGRSSGPQCLKYLKLVVSGCTSGLYVSDILSMRNVILTVASSHFRHVPVPHHLLKELWHASCVPFPDRLFRFACARNRRRDYRRYVPSSETSLWIVDMGRRCRVWSRSR